MNKKSMVIGIGLALMLFFVTLACQKKENDNDAVTSLLVVSALSQPTTPASTAPSLVYNGLSGRNAYATSSSVSFTASLAGFTASSYSVSPALPGSLTLNTTTGAISGTLPSSTQSATTYTVTATSSTGTTLTANLIIQVVSSSFFCNTSGTASGCTSSLPFTCSNSTLCFRTYALCTGDNSCGY